MLVIRLEIWQLGGDYVYPLRIIPTIDSTIEAKVNLILENGRWSIAPSNLMDVPTESFNIHHLEAKLLPGIVFWHELYIPKFCLYFGWL